MKVKPRRKEGKKAMKVEVIESAKIKNEIQVITCITEGIGAVCCCYEWCNIQGGLYDFCGCTCVCAQGYV